MISADAFSVSGVAGRMKAHAGLMVAFLLIAFVYFFGVAAEVYVGFGPPKSIISVFKQVNVSDLFHPQARLPLHTGIFVSCLGAVVIYSLAHSRRSRVLLSLLYVFAPGLVFLWLGADGWETVLMWLYVTLQAPLWTVSAIAGRQDGQFYAEGFLAATAAGWWSLMWIFMILREVYLCLPYDRVGQTVISGEVLSMLNQRRKLKDAC